MGEVSSPAACFPYGAALGGPHPKPCPFSTRHARLDERRRRRRQSRLRRQGAGEEEVECGALARRTACLPRSKP